MYTKSLVNANLFYVNFTNTTFQKIPIPNLTRMYYETHYQKYTPCLGINMARSLFIGISYGADPKL